MKVYVTTRFKGSKENKDSIEKLCLAVRRAGMQDFHFIRDVEHFEHTFDDPKELWDVARQKIYECDALLVDISDNPSGGRLVEVGVAFALKKPIFVIVNKGVEYKDFYEGIADLIIEYDEIQNITEPLRNILERN